MTFCSKCGNQVSEGTFCNVCGTPAPASSPPPPQPQPQPPPAAPPQYNAQEPPQQPQYQQQPQQYQPQQPQQYQQQPQQYQQQPQQYQQQPYQQQYAPPAQPSPIMTETISTIKAFLSPEPTNSIRIATASKANAWIIIAGLSVLLSALAITFLPGGIMAHFANSAMRAAGGFFGGVMPRISAADINREMPLGAFFGYGLLGSAVMYFAWTVCLKAVCAIAKTDAPFPVLLNLSAVSLLPSAATCILAIIIGFIYAPLAILLVVVGAVANLILLYHGVINTIQFRKNPFWLFVGAYAVCTIALYLLITNLVSAAMGFGLIDIFDMF